MNWSLPSVLEAFQYVLQTEQKYIGRWREAIDVEKILKQTEAYQRPPGVRYVVSSNVDLLCKSRYPVYSAAAEVKSTSTVVDQPISVPICVRLERMSEKSYELLCKFLAADPERTSKKLESILWRKFMGYAGGNFSDFERQKLKGSAAMDYNAVGESDGINRAKKM